jgi:hypothetical protein
MQRAGHLQKLECSEVSMRLSRVQRGRKRMISAEFWSDEFLTPHIAEPPRVSLEGKGLTEEVISGVEVPRFVRVKERKRKVFIPLAR